MPSRLQVQQPALRERKAFPGSVLDRHLEGAARDFLSVLCDGHGAAHGEIRVVLTRRQVMRPTGVPPRLPPSTGS